MLISLYIMLGLALVLGAFLGFAALKFKVEGDPLIARIDAILPQTQCGQCGFPGCKPYATAIAEGRADINQCPPGGDAGVHLLADLMGVEYKPLNAENGKSALVEGIFATRDHSRKSQSTTACSARDRY